jgi:hypothetical protein
MLCIKIQLFGAFCVALGCLLWRFDLFLDPLLVLFFDLGRCVCEWSHQHSVGFLLWFYIVRWVCGVGLLCDP